MMPRVSILTAVRDGGPHLDEAVASIRAQTLADWEWIIVDDGSADDTGARLERWARRDPRLRPERQPARGLVPALNAGLARCRAPLVVRMDADDIAHRERLAVQVAAFAADPALTVADGRVRLVGGARNDGMHRYVDWLNDHDSHESIAADLFVESPLVHPAVGYRRRAVMAAGGYRDGDFPEDYDLWLRLYAAGGRFCKLSREILCWRDHGRRLTRTDPRYRRAAFTALKQRHLWALEGRRIAAGPLALWGAGRGTRGWRRWLRRRGVQPAFVVDANPRRRGAVILGAPVVGAEELVRRAWAYLLVTVSSPDSRTAIRRWLAGACPDATARGRTVRFV